MANDDDSLSLQNFASEFLSLGRGNKTGTYRVVCADGREKLLLFREGLVVDIDTREEYSLLASAALATGLINDRELRRVNKTQAKTGAPLGALLVAAVTIPEEELARCVGSVLLEAVCGLFTVTLSSTSFTEHAADERLEGFASELSDVLEVHADPEDLFLEAARRLNRWDLVEREFGLLWDVYYATPNASRYFLEEGQYREETVVIGCIDGRNDFREVIQKAVEKLSGEMDPFQALLIIRSLVAEGDVEVLNPVELFQLALEYQEAGNHQKAFKLYSRASERGLDDFDVSFKLALTLEALGRPGEAAVKYQEFAEKCLNHSRFDDAIKSYRKATELEPAQLDWQRKLVGILLQENRREDALNTALKLSARRRSGGDTRGALDLLLDLRKRGLRDDRLGQRVLELADECGDDEEAQAERKRLASEFHAKKDVEKALQMYQQMFCEGNTSAEVRLKLVELHHQKGNHQVVLEHVGSLLSLSEPDRIKDPQVLRGLHELVCEIKPSDLRSNRWLVDYHLQEQNRDAALALLRSLSSRLERDGDPRDALRVLQQIVSLDPVSLDNRWLLVKAYERLGRTGELVAELRLIADHALKRQEPREAERALLLVLKSCPLDLEARKSLAEICAGHGDESRAAVYLREICQLDTLAGNLREAQSFCRRLLSVLKDDAEASHKLGELCAAVGEEQEAIQELIRAARAHLEARDLGRARQAVGGALKIKPNSGTALEVLRTIEEMEAVLSGGKGRTAPAPVAVAATPVVATPVAAAAPAVPAQPSKPGSIRPAAFEKSPPVIQKSVAGIMARLRGLKSTPAPGGVPTAETAAAAAAAPEAAPAGPAPKPAVDPARTPKPVAGGIGGAASKLKALASSRPAPAAAGSAAGASPAPEEAAAPPAALQITPDAVGLERLKASLQSPDNGPKPPAAAQSPEVAQKSLGGSAARLAKLKKAAPGKKKQEETEEARLEVEKETA